MVGQATGLFKIEMIPKFEIVSQNENMTKEVFGGYL